MVVDFVYISVSVIQLCDDSRSKCLPPC